MKTRKYNHKCYVEVNLVIAENGEHNIALKNLSKMMFRAYKIDRTFAFITKTKVYKFLKKKITI